MTLAYKILTADQWAQFQSESVFTGAPVDLADGYIHMSTAAQLAETARRHYAGRTGLVLVEIALKPLGEALKWEASRGGDLFPHLYGPLPTALAVEAMPVELDEGGVPVLGGLRE